MSCEVFLAMLVRVVEARTLLIISLFVGLR